MSGVVGRGGGEHAGVRSSPGTRRRCARAATARTSPRGPSHGCGVCVRPSPNARPVIAEGKASTTSASTRLTARAVIRCQTHARRRAGRSILLSCRCRFGPPPTPQTMRTPCPRSRRIPSPADASAEGGEIAIVPSAISPLVAIAVAEIYVGAVDVSLRLGRAAEAGFRRRCAPVFALSGQDAPHRLHRGARCGEENPRAPRVASRSAPHPAGPGTARHPRTLPCRLNPISAVDAPCVDGGERFELSPEREGTRLTLTHKGFRGVGPRLVSMILSRGWAKMLAASLAREVEGAGASH